MSTPIPPCPPFCDERSWMIAHQLEAIREHLYFEGRQEGSNPNIPLVFESLDLAINTLKLRAEKGEPDGSTD